MFMNKWFCFKCNHCPYHLVGSLTLKKNPSRRNELMANLSVDYSVCLDATPRASTTVTKRGQESAGPWHLSPLQWSFKQSEGDEETLHSSWSIYKKGIRENELEVVGEIWPADFCERKEAPTRDAAAANSQRRGPQEGWGRHIWSKGLLTDWNGQFNWNVWLEGNRIALNNL